MENQKKIWKIRIKYGKPENIMENQKKIWKTRKKYGKPENIMENQKKKRDSFLKKFIYINGTIQ